MFGAKTNALMVRSTVGLALVFLVTSLSLAHLSAQKEQSLIPDTSELPQINIPLEIPAEEGEPGAQVPAETAPEAVNVLPAVGQLEKTVEETIEAAPETEQLNEAVTEIMESAPATEQLKPKETEIIESAPTAEQLPEAVTEIREAVETLPERTQPVTTNTVP